MLGWARSFRVRILLLVCLVSGVPVGIVGLWITYSASRASERLLQARVEQALEQAAQGIVNRWVSERSAALDLAETPRVRQTVLAGSGDAWDNDPLTTRSLVLRDENGRTLASLLSGADRMTEPGIPLIATVYASTLGPAIGTLETTVPIGALVQDRAPAPGGVGITLGVLDRENSPLIPLPFEWERDAGSVIEWGGARWYVQPRILFEPPLTLIGAAPLTPFEQPLLDAARSSLWILLLVSATGLIVASVLTGHVTRGLDHLADAAEEVAAGALDRRVDEPGARELGRLARAFNRMTASLQATLKQLAERRALARTGEFAASLAHEVRNPLTAIRVDLQVAEEGLAPESPSRRPLRRALGEIDRLDSAVGSALMATRVALRNLEPIDLLVPLDLAIAAAEKTGARPTPIPLHVGCERPPRVSGDLGALEQVFLNLLLNAIDAVKVRGDVRVVVEEEDASLIVRVVDTGVGLSPEDAAQAFEPFFTTRERGTGLGLTIATRLARAHDGSVELAPTPGGGTTATVRLPRYDGTE